MNKMKWHRRKAEPTIQYEVDITKPPIFPPGKVIKTGFWGDYETEESIANGEAWHRYIEKYGEVLEIARSNHKD